MMRARATSVHMVVSRQRQDMEAHSNRSARQQCDRVHIKTAMHQLRLKRHKDGHMLAGHSHEADPAQFPAACLLPAGALAPSCSSPSAVPSFSLCLGSASPACSPATTAAAAAAVFAACLPMPAAAGLASGVGPPLYAALLPPVPSAASYTGCSSSTRGRGSSSSLKALSHTITSAEP
eukprot:CAMPEP_0202921482 /NCGR_PEP_ID=MMETSP1392-20130828/77416_1 /ASSEMBLY_ACC=CAM_ASM_000868 /TAXON_ID=225041 /ORGANISM="Chlamydomonas chlamydogama, Strain SAG 11-48b" /LENGTH=177 /DNA_ID=CAMNT_0049615053 /DNA_START=644 /DNA_END=1178 /DNA_ORIENTATION=-